MRFATSVSLMLVLAATAAGPAGAVAQTGAAARLEPSSMGAAPAAPPASPAPQDDTALTIASWGGAYGQSQELVYVEAFRAHSGRNVRLVAHGGNLEIILRRLAADPAPWDVVDLSAAALEAACRAGLVETVDAGALPPARDGTPAEEDFLAGGLHRCGAASVAWSAVLVYAPDAFKEPPSAVADLLDLHRFPGKRALPRWPRFTLEMSLLADGVPPAEVYPLLATDAGLARSLAALDRIKEQIVWWDSAQEALEHLANGASTMALAFNGRTFDALVRDKQAIAFLWDGQIYDVNFWAIPKTARDKAAAREFVAFASRPGRLAEQTRWLPYGPMRRSALAAVGKHAEVDVEMGPYLPTVADNLRNALAFDGSWWRQHEERLGEAFREWLDRPAARPEPVADPEIAPEE